MKMDLNSRVEATDTYVTYLSCEALSDWEGTGEGVRAMEDKIRLFGQGEVDPSLAPEDWPFQLVGMLGCGYTGVTKEEVYDALHDTGWTTTRYGALNPTGGAIPHG